LITLGRARSEAEQAHLGILCNAFGTSSTSDASGYPKRIQVMAEIVEICLELVLGKRPTSEN